MSNLRVFFNNLTKGLNLPNRYDENFDEEDLSNTNSINDPHHHFSSESFLSSVLEGIGDGLVVLNKNHSIITANHGFLEQVNMPEDEVIGRPCYKIYHNTEDPCYLSGKDCAVKRTFETGRNHNSVQRRVNDSGSVFYYETKSFPIKNSSGEIENVVKLFCDITKKANLEEELKKRVLELEEFYDMALGREIRIMELKNEISSLRNKLSIFES